MSDPHLSRHPDTTTIEDCSMLLGIGRSGTTFLAELTNTSTTPMRVVVEPLPRVSSYPEAPKAHEPWYVPPDPHSINYQWALSTLGALRDSCDAIRDGLRGSTIRRDDIDARFLTIKEVHGILAAPMLLEDLGWRGVVITRETARVIDSYFVGHARRRRKYLVDEAVQVKHFLRNPERISDRIRDLWQLTLDMTSKNAIRYLRRSAIVSSELARQACITHFLTMWLIAWASLDKRVHHVRYENLCRRPVEETIRIFKFLGLDHNANTRSHILQNICHGSSTDYYGTKKNSASMLNKPFAYLRPATRQWIARHIGAM